MKLVLLVILGAAIALGLTLYYQPRFFDKYLQLVLPSPDIVVTSPVSGQEVPLAFTVTGFAKTGFTLRVLNSAGSELKSFSVPADNFSIIVDLSRRASPGDRITLQAFTSPQNLLSLPLTIK